MNFSLWDLADNLSGIIFNSIVCKKSMSRKKINSEWCFVGLKNGKLIYRCRKWKEQWESFIKSLTRKVSAMKIMYSSENIGSIRNKKSWQISRLYAKSDKLLLADVFENCRNMCLKIYELDPTYFASAPGLVWQTCLKIQE